jgi:flagellar hook assembly protein FlgD
MIYSIQGKVVKELVDGYKEAGYHRVIWEGTNDSGESVSSGVYIYRIEAGNFSKVRKMVFLK